MTTDFAEALGTDLYLLEDRVTDEDRAVRDKVRAFTDAEIIPIINDYWDTAQFPFELVPKLATLGIIGYTIEGYGCPRRCGVPAAAGAFRPYGAAVRTARRT